jgi:hypothetical protein
MIVIFEIEYRYKSKYKGWRKKRISKAWRHGSFLVLARSRALAIKVYLRISNGGRNRQLLRCEKWCGVSQCTRIIIGACDCVIPSNATYEQVESKVKKIASTIVCNAVRFGQLVRPKECPICGSPERIEGHHADYNEPLQVEWMCKKCHEKRHHQEVAA